MPQTRINFKREYKLYEACEENDRFRPAMMMVHFKNGYAYASDSHILVRVPLATCTTFHEDEWKKLDGYSISNRQLKMLMSFNNARIVRTDDSCCIEAECGEDYCISFKLKPRTEVHVPNFDGVINEPRNAESTQKVGLRPSQLYRLARACNLDVAALNLSSSNKAIVIEAPLDGTICLIMPVLLSDY